MSEEREGNPFGDYSDDWRLLAMSYTLNERLEYRTYSDASEIERISGQWARLLESSSCNRAFASAEWYLGSVRAERYRSWNPLVIAAWHGSDIAGLLPLVLDPDRGLAMIPKLFSDYCDIIAREGDTETIVETLNYALVSHGGIKELIVEMVAEDSNLARAVAWLGADRDLECSYSRTEECRYIALPETFDDYLASKSKNFRKNLKRLRRRAEESGLILKELRPDEFDRAHLPSLILSMIQARHGEHFLLIKDSVRQILSEASPSLFEKGALRVFAIVREDRIIGLDVCMVWTRGLGTWNGGFLSEAEPWSPGTLLFAFGIEQAINSGLSEYDFLRGDEPYKERWSNRCRAIGKMEIVRNKLKRSFSSP